MSRSEIPNTRNAGFTLVETPVVLIIIASAATLLAGFAWQRPQEKTLAQSAKTLVPHMRRAQVEATAERQQQTVTVDLEEWLLSTPE